MSTAGPVKVQVLLAGRAEAGTAMRLLWKAIPADMGIADLLPRLRTAPPLRHSANRASGLPVRPDVRSLRTRLPIHLRRPANVWPQVRRGASAANRHYRRVRHLWGGVFV